MAKILLHTLGSSGDINPFVALGLELRRRGHRVTFAVSPNNAVKIRALGMAAVESGPDADPESDLMRRLLTRGPVVSVRVLYDEVLVPAICPAFDALLPQVRDCDLFVSHTIQLAARALAHRTNALWVSASPAALVHPTGESPPPGVAWKRCPGVFGRLTWRLASRLLAKSTTAANVEYAKLGVPPVENIVTDACSRRLTLGLWSPSYFSRPNDWPAWLQIGGYARWDGLPPPDAPPVVLPSGDAPLVIFTLGSSVVNQPFRFWQTALDAVAQMPCRALLLGAPSGFLVPAALQSRVTAARYAPYADVFPSASVIVHQGGVGTTQAACFYGIPSLVIPRGFDQWENAAHVQREGWGLRGVGADDSLTLLRVRLERLLNQTDIGRRAAKLGENMRTEAGVAASAALLEKVLSA